MSKSRALWTSMSSFVRLLGLRIKIMKRSYARNIPKDVYITTPIFYVNAEPHLGHLYSVVLADCMSRYRSMLNDNTFLSTGTDEHGNKVQTAAKSAGIPVADYCTQISWKYEEMCNKFYVDYSTFVRTTQQRHHKAVHHFWNVLNEREYIYLGKYSGWYCMSDEAFLSDRDIDEKIDESGKTIKISLESGHPVEWMEEENYKFRLSSLQDDLKYWIKQEHTVQPLKYRNILLNWIEEGVCLQDLSISRPTNRVSWSIPIPQNKNQSIYVWLDALINYLTAVGYPDKSYRQFWPPNLQIIGKDILKFHGIYWPAFLIAAGLEPPKTLLCHSHWIVDNQKMSKSKKNVVSPSDVANIFTEDGLRYFILREAVPHNDANYSVTKVQRVLNAELADTLGNLIARCTGKINPWKEVPNPIEYKDVLKSDVSTETIKQLISLHRKAQDHYDKYNLHHVVDVVMALLHSANQMIDYHKPWILRKQLENPAAEVELKAVISLALECARVSTLILFPIIPNLANNILDFLEVPQQNRSWSDTISYYQENNLYRNNTRNYKRSGEIIFKRINSM